MKKIIALLMTIFLIVSLSLLGIGCKDEDGAMEETSEDAAVEETQEEEAEEDAEVAEPVTITHLTGWIGEHVFANFFANEMERFNAAYEGKINVVLEEINDQEREAKIKVMLAAGDLPDVWVVNNIDTPKLAADAGMLVDMKPYLEADPDWFAELDQGVLDYWIRASGAPDNIYGIASHADIFGYYYNTEMFEAAGITPAETWDEFFSNCDKLKEAGYTPIGMMGIEGGLITDFWLNALVGTANDAGLEWVNTFLPTDWETPEVIEALGTIQTMYQEYTTADAVSLGYLGVNNYFLNEKAAILANGPWMISSIYDLDQAAEGLGDKIGHAAFPENAMCYNPGYAWFNAATTPETADAAATFIKFWNDTEGQIQRLLQINLTPTSPKVDVATLDIDPILAELITKSEGTTRVSWPWTLLSEGMRSVMSQQLAALAYGEVTPEEMAKTLSEAAVK